MKKISKVIIKNFQSHKYNEIEFGNFTCIVGASDNGKSAIFRAIKWCLYNEPSGSDFIRNGEEECSVTVLFDDGSEVLRLRGKTKNYYEICGNGVERLHLEGFGSGSVDEIVNFHGMHKSSMFKDQSLNMCNQLDSPFFLTESPAQKAVIIGRIGKTDIIDIAIKNTALSLRQSKAQIKELKVKLFEIKEKIKEYKNIPEMEKDLSKVEKKFSEIKTITEKIESINKVSKSIKKLENEKKELENLIHSESEIATTLFQLEKATSDMRQLDQVLKVYSNLKESLKSETDLKNTINKISDDELETSINKLKDTSETFKRIKLIELKNKNIKEANDKKAELIKMIEFSDKVESSIEKLSKISLDLKQTEVVTAAKNKLDFQISRKNDGDKFMKLNEDLYNKKFSEYKDALYEHKKCPICNAEITKERIDGITDIV